jgi:hypothetical protein
MSLWKKLFFILFAALSFPAAIWATSTEQKNLYFEPKITELMKNDIQFFTLIGSPKEILTSFPEAFDLDSVSALKEKNVKIWITKSAYLVQRPVGFFDHEHFKHPSYMHHLKPLQEVSQIDVDKYVVKELDGKEHAVYKKKFYFDSDDISTLPNSRITQAVSTAKKLDLLSQGASSLLLTEFTESKQNFVSGLSISSFIAIKEQKTLIITYTLFAVRIEHAGESKLKANFLSEIQHTQELINSFIEK